MVCEEGRRLQRVTGEVRLHEGVERPARPGETRDAWVLLQIRDVQVVELDGELVAGGNDLREHHAAPARKERS